MPLIGHRRARFLTPAVAVLPPVLLLALLLSVRLRWYGPLRLVRQFNKRVFNHLPRPWAGRRGYPFALIRHRGRRSGREYETPVYAIRSGGGFSIVLTYGPGTDWCRNVRAAGEATLLHHGAAYAVGAPEVVDGTVALSAAPPAVRLACRLLGIREFLKVTIESGPTE